MNFVNKEELRSLIERYQVLNDDVDDSWVRRYKNTPRKKMEDPDLKSWERTRDEFKAYKSRWYADKRKRMEVETDSDRLVRNAELRIVENSLSEVFYKMIDEFANTGTLYKMKRETDLYDDMRQETVMAIWRYMNRFDTRKKNPFAYFTELIKHSLHQERNDEFKHRLRYLSFSFLESFDSPLEKMEDGAKNIIPKSLKKDILQGNEKKKTRKMDKFIVEEPGEDSSVG